MSEMEKTISGMERLNKIEVKVGILDERTLTTDRWMNKIEKKVDHLIWKFAGANAILGVIIVIVLMLTVTTAFSADFAPIFSRVLSFLSANGLVLDFPSIFPDLFGNGHTPAYEAAFRAVSIFLKLPVLINKSVAITGPIPVTLLANS